MAFLSANYGNLLFADDSINCHWGKEKNFPPIIRLCGIFNANHPIPLNFHPFQLGCLVHPSITLPNRFQLP